MKICNFCNHNTESVNVEKDQQFNIKTYTCNSCNVEYTFLADCEITDQNKICTSFYHQINNKYYKLMVPSKGSLKLFQIKIDPNIKQNTLTSTNLIKQLKTNNLNLNPESAKNKILTILTMI